MNKEIIKAINKDNNKPTFRKWWNKNGYKVLRVLLFPIWIYSIIKEKTEKKLNARQVWSEERAKEILNYYIPRRAEWCAEDKSFYFFDNGMGWGNLAKKYLKRKDRRWWKNHNGFWGGDIRKYLIKEFELDGFTKEVGNCSEGWTDITFRMKAEEKDND